MTESGSEAVGHGLALWLMPGDMEPWGVRLTILEFTKSHGLDTVPPHVTLLSSLTGDPEEILQRADLLAKKISRLPFTLDGFGWTESYFRSFYMTLAKEPMLEFVHQLAERTMQVTPTEPYLPHLSLAYGWADETAKRREANRLTVSDLAPPISGAFEELCLVSCEGPKADWYLIKKWKLSKIRTMKR